MTPMSNMTVDGGHKTTNDCCRIATSPDKPWITARWMYLHRIRVLVLWLTLVALLSFWI